MQIVSPVISPAGNDFDSRGRDVDVDIDSKVFKRGEIHRVPSNKSLGQHVQFLLVSGKMVGIPSRFHVKRTQKIRVKLEPFCPATELVSENGIRLDFLNHDIAINNECIPV